MRSMYNQYKEKDRTSSPNQSSSIPTRDKDEDNNDKKNNFNIHKWRFGDMQENIVDEFTRYLEAPVLVLLSTAANDVFSPLAWWKDHEMEYPTLARIAFNVFCIPSMSVEPERMFSGYEELESEY